MDTMTLFTSTRTRRTTASVAAGMTLMGAAAVGFSAPAQAATEETWDAIAFCESTNRWDINTGNGFYGGLQFTLSSWQGVGGQGYPHQASKAEQIKRAEMLQDLQGWGAWPKCAAGLTQADADATDAAPVAVERTSSVQRQAAAEQAAAEEAAAEQAAAEEAAAEQAAAEEAAAEQAAAEEAAAEQAAAEQWAAEQAAAEQAAAERAEAKRAAAAEKAAAKKAAAAERAAAHQAAAEQAVVAEAETIVVKAGDSLWKLAAEHEVEGGWTALYEANKDTVSDAAMIYVGQELVLPQA
ncbi:nucleoid-associated protein YgaU [Micrococcus endophyticus]|uniref:Nucleoid-associated protein YgaU n=1 Tax=Micrococcus endophyticus TaxID=455343 RepID=A0A7W9JHA4_9MICC|nr:transglycosylase family protein [Micrococcus endophyticus]MBB5847866.1 nucleoid-associated protein YgaU [Micrococcus endophyticus]